MSVVYYGSNGTSICKMPRIARQCLTALLYTYVDDFVIEIASALSSRAPRFVWDVALLSPTYGILIGGGGGGNR